jgi:hypothetical protein
MDSSLCIRTTHDTTRKYMPLVELDNRTFSAGGAILATRCFQRGARFSRVMTQLVEPFSQPDGWVSLAPPATEETNLTPEFSN